MGGRWREIGGMRGKKAKDREKKIKKHILKEKNVKII